MGTDNRRQAPRFRVLKDAKAVTHHDWSVVDCCLRDWSETGARLRCADPAAIPNEFRLLVCSDATIRDARVMWRRGEEIGVKFTGPARRAPPRKW